MLKLLHNPIQIVTIDTSGKNIKRGKNLLEANVLENHSIIIENDIIKDLVLSSSINNPRGYHLIDLKNKVILPGLVECHTHSAFAGSRAEEFKQKISGIKYEEIAKAGGGINTTVQAVRNSSFEELVKITKEKVDYFISQGVTTLEIKSGYGLDFDNEIKLLKVINHLNEKYPIDIIPTFLGAHTFPPEFKDNREAYIKLITDKMLPYIFEKKYAKFCDGFCEQTAFTADEIDQIFSKAASIGFKLRLHSEQFNSIGGLEIALKHKAVSIDHLEIINEKNILKISNSDAVAVLLPGVSFFLNYQYAPARDLIRNNAIVALTTDFNPGSSHIPNLNLIMSIAAINMNMKIEEILSAFTINAAAALCMNENIGSIEIGKKADFSVFETTDYSNIIYTVGKNLNCMTIKNGKIIYSRNGIN
jgi:imidazolonepropionase